MNYYAGDDICKTEKKSTQLEILLNQLDNEIINGWEAHQKVRNSVNNLASEPPTDCQDKGGESAEKFYTATQRLGYLIGTLSKLNSNNHQLAKRLNEIV